ncbi:MAG: zinc ribbon domain-containing protein, partial [Streptosporangiaceae bacterium]
RKAGPPREGPALCQGIIICGRCGQRMTVRYRTRRGAGLPYYMCQRPGTEHAAAICQAVPGAGIDTAIGQLLVGALTPLAIEAALTVAAELEHRADAAGKLRAATVERARYHADAARRRYLAVDPANRLVAATLEAGWNTALREVSDAQDACDKATSAAAAGLTDVQKARIGKLTSDFPAIWNDPATPSGNASGWPGCCSPTSPSPRTTRRSPATSGWPAARTTPSPCPGRSRRPSSARPRRTSSRPSTSCWITTPAPRPPASWATAACSPARAGHSARPASSTSAAPTSYAAAASAWPPPACSP